MRVIRPREGLSNYQPISTDEDRIFVLSWKKRGKGTPSFNAVPLEEFVECIHDGVSARDRENYGRKKRSLV